MSNVDTLLSNLNNVRKTGPASWSAQCPAHSDRTNSLSVTDKDGTTLVHCFAGCSTHEVVGAVGMEISDLFPPTSSSGKPQRSTFPAMAALRAVSFEALVVGAAATSLLAGTPLSAVDRQRLMLAIERIQTAVSACSPRAKGARYD